MLLPRDVFPHLYLSDESILPETSSKARIPPGVTVRTLPGGCLLYTLPNAAQTQKRSI